LHAALLVIPHPKTDELMSFAASLPLDMGELIAALR
jgi:hypothetical protein